MSYEVPSLSAVSLSIWCVKYDSAHIQTKLQKGEASHFKINWTHKRWKFISGDEQFDVVIKKLGVSPANLFKSTKVLMATPQGRRLGYHTPEQVSNRWLRWICKRLLKLKSFVLSCMLHKMPIVWAIETAQCVKQYDWQRSYFIHQLSQVSVKTVDTLRLKAIWIYAPRCIWFEIWSLSSHEEL